MTANDENCEPGTALFGWSPSRLAADTGTKRWVDRVMPSTGVPLVLYFGTAGLLVVAGLILPGRLALASVAVGSLFGGLWCCVNFWRCRHAHCLVTGLGWLSLSAVATVGFVVGHSLVGRLEPAVFLVVFVVSLVFERYWMRRSGTNAVCTSRS